MEHQVAGEEHSLVRQPRDQVSRRVGVVSGVEEVDPPCAGEHGQAGTDDDAGHPSGHVSPLRHRVPYGRTAVDHRIDEQCGTHVLVTDERGLRRQEAIAVGVVPVLVGVHRESHGLAVGGNGDCIEESPRPLLGRTGVDDQRPVPAGDGTGVVEPPRAVRLDPCMHTVDDLFEARRRRSGVCPVAVVRLHPNPLSPSPERGCGGHRPRHGAAGQVTSVQPSAPWRSAPEIDRPPAGAWALHPSPPRRRIAALRPVISPQELG